MKNNGFYKSEPIILKKINCDKYKYIVIEGNRRVAAIIHILNDKDFKDEEIKKSISQPISFVLDSETKEINLKEYLAARHNVGVKHWGLSERITVVASIYEDIISGKVDRQETTPLKELCNRAGISSPQSAVNLLLALYLKNELFNQLNNKIKDKLSLDLFVEAARNNDFRNWIGLDSNTDNYLNSDITKTNNFEIYVDLINREIITGARDTQRPMIRAISTNNKSIIDSYFKYINELSNKKEYDNNDLTTIAYNTFVADNKLEIVGLLDHLNKILQTADQKLFEEKEVKNRLSSFMKLCSAKVKQNE